MRPIGDSFIRWEFFECKCKEAKKARKEHEKWKKEHGIDMSKIMEEIKSKRDGEEKQN